MKLPAIQASSIYLMEVNPKYCSPLRPVAVTCKAPATRQLSVPTYYPIWRRS